MKTKILRIFQASMLVAGVGVLSGCFGPPAYYGSPGYAYAPAPYRYGPAYYPPRYAYEPGYRVPNRPPAVRYYNGGEHAWEHGREAHADHH